MPWTSDTASAYARLRFVLQNETGPIGAMDMLIAAHALAGNMVLVTRDRAFQRVNGLRYEDWTI
jgi:tRNA(fMet)-specific endonuclease VapC